MRSYKIPDLKGEQRVQAKITDAQARALFAEYCNGATAKSLSERYGLSTAAIYDICSGRTWRHLNLLSKGRPNDRV